MRLLLLITAAIVFALPILPQADRVQVSVTPSPRGNYEVVIRNNYDKPLLAYIIVDRHLDGKGRIEESFSEVDAVLTDGILYRIGPGREESPFGFRRPPVDVRVVGALFADGMTEGDPVWVQKIIEKRKRIYEDIPIALDKLQKYLAQRADTPEVVKDFQEDLARKEANVKDLKDFQALGAVAVPNTVVTMLKSARSGATGLPPAPEAALQIVIDALRELHEQLRQSRPLLE